MPPECAPPSRRARARRRAMCRRPTCRPNCAVRAPCWACEAGDGCPTPSRDAPGADQCRRSQMKGPVAIVGIVLIILGVVALGYQGITYTTREKVLEVGPITATKETKRTVPLPPVLGGLALAGGIVLLVIGARR